MNIIAKLSNRLYKILYWPVCRAYGRYFVGDKPADLVMCFLSALEFWKTHSYWPNFKNPRSFSEKIFSRMLYDRNPKWTMLSDKLSVRDYVDSKVGAEYLIPLLWSGNNPEEIPFEILPQQFVIKANHGCGYNIIVKDKSQLDRKKAIQRIKKWLGENFCESSFLGVSWGYKNIKPAIIVEAFLDNNGKVPVDYKFFCFSGRAEFIQVSFDRFGDASESILNRDFNKLDVYNGLKLYLGKVLRPVNYNDMVRVADLLSRDLDFIRVDLYTVDNRIYVGELTCYPAGGFAKFVPQKYDYIFGEKWKMN